MNLKNFHSGRKIFVLTLACIFTILPAFSQNNLTENEVKKSVIENNMINLSEDYLSQVETLFYLQRDIQDYEQAIKTVNYLINASTKYYGEANPQTGFAYLARARYYITIMIPDLAKKDLDKVYEIYQLNKDNQDLRNNILLGYVNFYSSTEENYNSLKYYNEALDKVENNISANKNIAQIYINMKNYKEAKKYIDKYYEDIQKDKENQNANLFEYHMLNASYYQTKQEMVAFKEELNKAEEIIKSFENPKQTELQILFNINKVQYYLDMKQFDKALILLDENKELISKNGQEYQKQNILQQYLDYYKEQKDLNKFNKYAKNINKFYNTLPSNSLLFLTLADKQIDLYKDLGKLSDADEYCQQALDKIEPVKDYIPYQYSKFLKKAAEIKQEANNLAEAKIYLDKTMESYKKVLPETANEFNEIYKIYGDIAKSEKDMDKAKSYYEKAISIIKNIQGENSDDVADIYFNLANIYIETDKIDQAIAYANNAYKIKENLLGTNHIKTLKSKLDKYNIYKAAGLTKESETILNEINSIVDNKQEIGIDKEFNYKLNLINADLSYEYQQYDKAIEYAEKALDNTNKDQEKIDVYNILYNIYINKNNKIKAYKYKKLANIE